MVTMLLYAHQELILNPLNRQVSPWKKGFTGNALASSCQPPSLERIRRHIWRKKIGARSPNNGNIGCV